jgi:hypothetical protein
MAFVPPARHLLRAKDLADARYFEPLGVDDLARAAGAVFLSTDDCQASYEDLKARGVEFVDQPHEQAYGIDSSFRDPSGNQFRLIELRELSPT